MDFSFLIADTSNESGEGKLIDFPINMMNLGSNKGED